jgi:L,D-peptidoglycan transpeptidase YkuD (ErfK/YbiS/YcfS/YnhG family)
MDIFVTPAAMQSRGLLKMGDLSAPCALGSGGMAAAKSEGDGTTPIGAWPVRRIWYRPDREARPITALQISQISRKSGWCDDVDRAEYNLPVALPFDGSHEILWRDDGLYDIFLELGYNDDPPVAPAGSAIFLHLEKNNFQPTRGCIAVARAVMGHILTHITDTSIVQVG